MHSLNHGQRFGRWSSRVLFPIFTSSLLLASMAAQAQQGLPPWECGTNFSGLLFQHDTPNLTPTTLQMIEMVTGEFEPGVSIDDRPINAVGYNVLDDYVYGWDTRAGEIVRIGDDGNTEGLGAPEGHEGGRHMIIGDVDDNGHYWYGFPGDNAPIWHQVDLDVDSPDFMTVIRTVRPDTWPGSNDWAYVPGTDALWTIGHDDNGDNTLLRFDRATGTFSDEGSLGVGSAINSGAMYADTDGFLYTSNNNNGQIYRVDVANVTATLFAPGPASSGNDGARCPSPVLLDFGDAPDSYGTELASDGPRHGIPDYDEQTGEAPLMLGASIDSETDGFPGPDADGDDSDNLGDEDGVAAPIVITDGAQTTVSVSATNTSGDPATLAGWIDLDGNGTFDAGELQTATVPAGTIAGNFDLTFDPPTALGDTYARFRIFPGDISAADLSPTGPAAAGEVEDYLAGPGRVMYEKTVTPQDVTELQPGDSFTYTVAASNTGALPLTGLSFTDDLTDVLDDATFNNDENATIGTVEFDDVEQTVTWMGALDVGQSAAITYSVTIDDPPGGDAVLINGVFSDDPGSNCASTPATDPSCVTQVPQPLVTRSKALTGETGTRPNVAEPGEQLTYTITLGNAGGADTTDAGVIDQLDPNVIFVSADNGGVLANGTVEWSGLTVAAGDTLELTVVVEVVDPIPFGVTTIGNVAFDPNEDPPLCDGDPLPPTCVITSVAPEPVVVPINTRWMLMLLMLTLLLLGAGNMVRRARLDMP